MKTAMLNILKAVWRHWKRLAHGIIAVQNWTLMAVAYVVGMGPVALVMRLKNPDLIDRGLGDQEGPSYWLPVQGERQDIRRAQRPY